jgi:hypothetical protein
MNLYLKIVDGQPEGHPYFEDNLLTVYKGLIPSEYQPFLRVAANPSEYMVPVASAYQLVDGVWQDTWEYREMTTAERAEIDSMWEMMNNSGSGSVPDVI